VFLDFVEGNGPKPASSEKLAEGGDADSWKSAFVALPAAGVTLRILTGLAKGNPGVRTRFLARPVVVSILHQIEHVTSEKHIGNK